MDFDGPLGPELTREYLETCRRALEEARTALGKGGRGPGRAELESVRAAAHRLAGSAGTYGFPEASAVALRLEKRLLAALSAPAQQPAGIEAALEGELEALGRALGL